MVIRDIMRQDFVVIEPDAGVRSIEDELLLNGFLVVKEGREFVGLLVTIDVVACPHLLVRDCLDNDKMTFDATSEIEPVLNFMQGGHIPALPVFDKKRFVGVITLEDIVDYYLFRYRRDLEGQVKLRTRELRDSNLLLRKEIRERQRAEKELRQAHDDLEHKVVTRTAELTKTNKKLEKALAEIKTLNDILPLCSFCKKIRDEQGNWEQVDVYIHKHAGVDISHSVCPDCMEKHYPSLGGFKKGKQAP